MSLEQQISELNATIKTLNETIKLLLQRDVISAPQVQVTIPPVQEVQTQTFLPDEAKAQMTVQEVQTQETFLPDEAKAQMTVKEFQDLCLSLIRSNAANKEIIKAIMLSNFDVHKASDLADNQIALCAAMITEATKD